MTTLRTTAIMKTDISGSTARFRTLAEADLRALLAEHRGLLTHHAAAHGGHIVKPEGDGFWLVFPSVTAAALAAMAMQEELKLSQPNRGDDRLVMRVVIAVGDVLHEEGALVGDAVVLTTRIEAVTPPDEIHLSASAWLAVNQAEIRTALAGTFALKGYLEPVPVYRIEQTSRTRVLDDQYILVTDLRGFGRISEGSSLATVEKVLDGLLELTRRVSRELGGVIRFSAGDSYCLTFADADHAVVAAERLGSEWAGFTGETQIACAMNIAVHVGNLRAFRSYLYGSGLDVTHAVERACAALLGPGKGGVFVTGEVRKALAGTAWEARLRRVDVALPAGAATQVYRLDAPTS